MLCRLKAILLDFLLVEGPVELVANVVIRVQGCHTVLGNVCEGVLLTIRLARLEAAHALFYDRIGPKLPRFKLPLIRIVLTWCDARAASFYFKGSVVAISVLKFEKVRLFQLFNFVGVELLSRQELHLLLEVLVCKVFCEKGSIFIFWVVHGRTVCVFVEFLLHLLIVYFQNFLQSVMQLVTHFRLHLLEPLVEFDLGLHVRLLLVTLSDLLVLFVAGLEAHEFEVLSHALHGEHGCPYLAVSLNSGDRKQTHTC